jgi:hypothetical protein
VGQAVGSDNSPTERGARSRLDQAPRRFQEDFERSVVHCAWRRFEPFVDASAEFTVGRGGVPWS